ncbi:MAG: PTS transporter subunit EIIC [Eubacteriales bacterium]|nr:PTS transporter subunit EIIC [Eubacteriales bacterium]
MSSKTKKKTLFSVIIDAISESMGPVIPIIIAGGIVKLFDLILIYTGILTEGSSTEKILSIISDSPFYFLPFLVAWSSAIHFGANIPAAIASVGVLLSPSFIQMAESGESLTFAGLKVISGSYAYATLPIILLIAIMAKAEKFLHKHLPGYIDDTLTPFFLLLFISLLGLLIICPIGTIAGNAFYDTFLKLTKTHPVFAWSLFSAITALLIITGTHWVFVTETIAILGEAGIDVGVMVSLFILTMAQGGMAIAVFFRSKSPAVKKNALTCGITVLFTGITEPPIFGIALKHKWPLITSMLGAAVAGIYQGIVSINCYIFTSPNLISCLMFSDTSDPQNFIQALIAGGIAFAASFLFTLIFPGKLSEE